jgi:cobalt-zinc-cadmium efflux system outer membrane protein
MLGHFPRRRTAVFRHIGKLLLLTVSLGGAAHAQELTLKEAIEAALAGNPALRSFAFELRAQDAVTRRAGLRPTPEIDLDAENLLGSGEFEATDAAELTLSLSQVIELGGKRNARIDAANAARDAIEVERQAAQLDVLADVTRRFVGVLTRQEQLALAERAVGVAERTVAAAKTRVDAARAPHAELDRARIALDRALIDERRSRSQLDSARRQLAATWGDAALRAENVQGDLYAMPTLGDFSELRQRLDLSPDFLRFASEARLRDAEQRLAATSRKPDLGVSAGVRRLEATDDFAFVASVSVPLYSARRAEASVAEAGARRARVDADSLAARVRTEATLYELHHEIETAVLEVRTLHHDVLPRAAEALEETDDAFRRGRFSFLELVDAQREYLALQSALIESAAKVHTLTAEIERLVNAPLTDTTP